MLKPRRTGKRKPKSVHVLNLVTVKKGEGDIPGLTVTTVLHWLGSKKPSGIQKLFRLLKKKMMSANMLSKIP